ncbi:MAG: 30S ribosomal protein S17 [Clostridia bacterium]|jgi:small subunit ribosomal protein S17|nr:30S ribosomal protein S17 [Clostridia bacterium]
MQAVLKKPVRNSRKTRIGIVTSDKMDKTIVVQVEQLVKHKLYKKYINRRSKFKAHDEKNECKIGDRVKIMETRPLSKEKCWRLVKILESKN